MRSRLSPSIDLQTHLIAFFAQYPRSSLPNCNHVVPVRSTASANIRGEDRSSRSRNRDGLQHVQPVHLTSPQSPSTSATLPLLTVALFTPLTLAQTGGYVYEKVHSQLIPRSRPQQGRVRVSGPVRSQVLRGQRESIGEDAGRGGAEGRRRGRREWWWHVWIMKEWTAIDGQSCIEGQDR